MNYLKAKAILIVLVISLFQSLAAEPIPDLQEQVDKKPPFVLVIFGATGDLSARKLFPAVFNLNNGGKLSDDFAVIGIGRRELKEEEFLSLVKDSLNKFSRAKPAEQWKDFEQHLFYNYLNFEEDAGYAALSNLISGIEKDYPTQGNVLFYLATEPAYFPVIIEKLQQFQLINKIDGRGKVIIEKPFGSDLESANYLQDYISQFLREDQIYRMDHYNGKEGVKNLFAFRFEDASFEPFWNNQYVEYVQMTLSEDIGIGTRANFWEKTGTLRDVVQNHMMQLLAFVAMDAPKDSSCSALHAEKVKLMDAIRPIAKEKIDQFIIPGQYGSGCISGLPVLGYREEKDVPCDSQRETFVQAKLFIDNARWNGVPFYLRTGKRLPRQTTEIAVKFKNPLTEHAVDTLYISIQPVIGIYLRNADSHIVRYEFGSVHETSKIEAYENLLNASIKSDQTSFVAIEEVLAAWKLLTPVLEYWDMQPREDFPNYDAGTWGPCSADWQINMDGIGSWLLLEISK